MTVTDATWPRQIRLPGQAAAPEGPVEMDMMYLMHHAFRRDLDRFCDAVRHTPVQARQTWSALLDRWELFAQLLHQHHSGEDAGLWPWLRAHVEAAERAVLDAMEAEHAEIDPLLESCAAGLRRLSEHADEDARAALAVRMTAARDSLHRHLRHEETDAIAMIQRTMAPEDWDALVKEHFDKGLGLRQILRALPWLADGVPREVLDVQLRKNGPAMRLLHAVTRRGWARREAQVFGHR